MGQKIHPIGFRIGVSEPWRSRWFARGNDYAKQVLLDYKVRELIKTRHRKGIVSRIDIQQRGGRTTVMLLVTRKGEVIGKGYANRDLLVCDLEAITGGEVKLDIQEVRHWDLDSQTIAENLAAAVERRVSPRYQVKRIVENAMNAGAEGIRVQVSGRIDGAEMSRTLTQRQGRIPLQTLSARCDYGFSIAETTYGIIGVKVWIYKGEDQGRF
ncbi:MAG: 30S ribosomal protein S3 [Planctomycetes bacterium]|jgi:small subunit ribosomal protein S3|nr:30S ribosomal protein S3 [Planctomycetota bacterium]MBT4028265.1 30S ribosomal protein S3 [Planctomycetota bacterium]MBT4560942.1 30S ribosomal protein S3 [Planctomycetota bacterium]MBT5101317.1 30S ribosomal protein S3 [Planctomycetota bacterium]MBT5120681.1 30S ribosomal protein S3 [Planctomycetota bacterium]